MTEFAHPGAYGTETSFSDFEPFIKTGDAPPWVKGGFNDFLRELFERTGRVWVPASCYSTAWMEEQTKEILKKGGFSNMKVEPRQWARGHFWLVVNFEGFDGELVVDPTGVNTPGQDYYVRPETIVPFFGDKNLAPSFSKRIYEQGEPLGERGYHVFHP